MVTKGLLTPSEAARFLGVSPVTVRVWARKGKLPAHTTPGGHRRFDAREIRDFARRHGMTFGGVLRDRMRILIVEDEPQFAAFVSEALKTLEPKPEIENAYDGFEAGRLRGFQPDLVLLDLMLPGVDGFAICERLRNDPETRHIRVIAMTGYDTPENRTRIIKAGAENCLAKPFRTAKLLAAVKPVTAAGRAEPASAAAAG